jgi:hypothetical protein
MKIEFVLPKWRYLDTFSVGAALVAALSGAGAHKGRPYG